MRTREHAVNRETFIPGNGAPRSNSVRLDAAPPRLIVVVILEPVKALDLLAVTEVFSEANRVRGTAPRYRVCLVSTSDEASVNVETELFTYRTESYQGITDGIDSLIIVGSEGPSYSRLSTHFKGWLRTVAGRTRRVASISSGTLLLADAGILDQRRITIHSNMESRVVANYSRLRLVKDVLFVQDGRYFTCAGATASIDLTLAFVEEDYGTRTANRVARSMLLYLHRTGDTPQISITLQAQNRSMNHLGDLIAWLPDNLREDLSITTLAKRAAMSTRNFARVFKEEVGITPAKYVHNLRLEAARRQLAFSSLSVDGVAEACGFPSGGTLRRLFVRLHKVAPGRYRSEMTPAS